MRPGPQPHHVTPRLSSFLSKNNLLDANQSGFRRGHSTETALLSVIEASWISKADSKSSVLILLDLSAAFYSVSRQILLSTISSLGITGIPLGWFVSYLTGRSFNVAWEGEVFRAHQLVTGVPQGSILGPLLFFTYTTSLGPIIQAHGFSYHCYADDTQLYLSFRPDNPTVAARISGCLADISAWMEEHHLQLNLEKKLSFLSSLPLQLYNMILPSRLLNLDLNRNHILCAVIGQCWGLSIYLQATMKKTCTCLITHIIFNEKH